MKNIEDYICTFHLEKKLTEKLLYSIEKYNNWGIHSYSRGQDLEIYRNENEFEVSNICKIDEYIGLKLMDSIFCFLGEYCDKMEHLIKLKSPNQKLSWAGFTEPRVNNYNKNTLMSEHFDHINSIFDGEKKGIPTFTILGLIKNADKGGEFIMWGDKVIAMNPGDLVIFPSNFMFRHKVNEILEGTRISFVSWAWG